METKITFPEEVADLLERPIERAIMELVAIGLYREGKITLRQTADLVGVNVKEMLKVLAKHNSYISYGVEELREDISYASSE